MSMRMFKKLLKQLQFLWRGSIKTVRDPASALYQNSVPKTITVDRTPPSPSHLVIFSKGKFAIDTHSSRERGKLALHGWVHAVTWE